MGPAMYSFLSYDGTKANLNTYVRVVTFAFTWGYLVALALEIVVVRGRRWTMTGLEHGTFGFGDLFSCSFFVLFCFVLGGGGGRVFFPVAFLYFVLVVCFLLFC